MIMPMIQDLPVRDPARKKTQSIVHV